MRRASRARQSKADAQWAASCCACACVCVEGESVRERERERGREDEREGWSAENKRAVCDARAPTTCLGHRQRDAGIPGAGQADQLVGPARGLKAPLQVIELGVRDGDAEGRRRGHCFWDGEW